MLISGRWHLCDDGIVRPVVPAEVLSSDGSWIKAPFLLDTGADRTVLSADVLKTLRSKSLACSDSGMNIRLSSNETEKMETYDVDA